MSSELRYHIATEDISHGSLCWVLSRNSKARHQTFVLRVIVTFRELELFEAEDRLHDIFLLISPEECRSETSRNPATVFSYAAAAMLLTQKASPIKLYRYNLRSTRSEISISCKSSSSYPLKYPRF